MAVVATIKYVSLALPPTRQSSPRASASTLLDFAAAGAAATRRGSRVFFVAVVAVVSVVSVRRLRRHCRRCRRYFSFP